jgi:hypothetical protein
MATATSGPAAAIAGAVRRVVDEYRRLVVESYGTFRGDLSALPAWAPALFDDLAAAGMTYLTDSDEAYGVACNGLRLTDDESEAHIRQIEDEGEEILEIEYTTQDALVDITCVRVPIPARWT